MFDCVIFDDVVYCENEIKLENNVLFLTT